MEGSGARGHRGGAGAAPPLPPATPTTALTVVALTTDPTPPAPVTRPHTLSLTFTCLCCRQSSHSTYASCFMPYTPSLNIFTHCFTSLNTVPISHTLLQHSQFTSTLLVPHPLYFTDTQPYKHLHNGGRWDYQACALYLIIHTDI